MPGQWLGESSIPVPVESGPGVFEFGFYRTTSGWTRFVAFSILFTFATAICGTGLVLFWGVWRPFLFLAGFYLVAVGLLFFAIYSSTHCVIDVPARCLSRAHFLLSRRLFVRSLPLQDGDTFTLYVFPHDSDSGGEHRVCVTRDGVDRLFCVIHLDSADPSDQLEEWVSQFAKALNVDNAGYASRMQYLRRLARFRM